MLILFNDKNGDPVAVNPRAVTSLRCGREAGRVQLRIGDELITLAAELGDVCRAVNRGCAVPSAAD